MTLDKIIETLNNTPIEQKQSVLDELMKQYNEPDKEMIYADLEESIIVEIDFKLAI